MPLVTYSLLRLGLLVVALVGLALAGMGGWLLVVVATVVAFVLSYVLLPRQRDAAARWLAERGTRRGGARDDGGASRRGRFARGVEDDAEAEDAAADAATHGTTRTTATTSERQAAPGEADPTGGTAAPERPAAAGRDEGAPEEGAPEEGAAPEGTAPESSAPQSGSQTARPSPSSTP